MSFIYCLLLLCTTQTAIESSFLRRISKAQRFSLPKNFDSRTKWPDCKSISTIHDQSGCGCCYAAAVASVLSDRICIASGQKKNVLISVKDLISCGEKKAGNGCHGGLEKDAWTYIKDNGVVTGGSFGDNSTCQPFPFKPCAHYVNSSRLEQCPDIHQGFQTPKCERTCVNGANYEKDKYFVSQPYSIKSEMNIQWEIIKNGSVTASFVVHEDFLEYKNGIYQHRLGAPLWGHSTKILGWGVENGTKYWLCANSWNEEWGDKGFFRIKRGSNECRIEEFILAAKPILQNPLKYQNL